MAKPTRRKPATVAEPIPKGHIGLPRGWSTGRLQGFIIGILRAGHKRWPIKIQVKNGAKTERRINPASGRMAQFYLCSSCKGEFLNHEVEVDHILPVVDPTVGFVDWDTFISRLFSPEENYSVLCIPCHRKKTKEERIIAKMHKMSADKTTRGDV